MSNIWLYGGKFVPEAASVRLGRSRAATIPAVRFDIGWSPDQTVRRILHDVEHRPAARAAESEA
jgi:hypothetical protein